MVAWRLLSRRPRVPQSFGISHLLVYYADFQTEEVLGFIRFFRSCQVNEAMRQLGASQGESFEQEEAGISHKRSPSRRDWVQSNVRGFPHTQRSDSRPTMAQE